VQPNYTAFSFPDRRNFDRLQSLHFESLTGNAVNSISNGTEQPNRSCPTGRA
jgi:hypothetical protein